MKRRVSRWPWPLAVFTSAGIFGGVLWVQTMAGFEWADLKLRDVWTASIQREPNRQRDVVVIGVDEEDIQQYGHPVPDQLLAQVIQNLFSQGARTVGVDLFRDIPGQGRDQLASVVAMHPQTVFIERRLAQPIFAPEFAQADQVGFADLIQDRDGAIRRTMLLLYDDANRAYPAFSLQLARQQLAPEQIDLKPADDNPYEMQLGATQLHRLGTDSGAYQHVDEGGYQVLLRTDFTSPLAVFSLRDVLSGGIPVEVMKHKAVLIGMTAVSVPDLHRVPHRFPWTVQLPMRGVFLHAYMTDQLVQDARATRHTMRWLPESTELICLMIAVWVGTLLGCFVRSGLWHLGWLAVTNSSLLLLHGGLFFTGIWLPIVAMLTANTLAHLVGVFVQFHRVSRQRKQLMQLFGRFVSKEVAEHLWLHRQTFMAGEQLRSQKQFATILMVDLQGYTHIVEQHTPEAVMVWIGECMEVLSRAIAEHGGVVDDYAGDGIKANFGVPITSKFPDDHRRDAQRAIHCALMLIEQIKQFNQHALAPVKLRIGVASGWVVSGSIGSDTRMKFTTIGDVVNVAARLEALDKAAFKQAQHVDGRVLVNEQCLQLIESQFKTCYLGMRPINGKAESIPVYQVLEAATI